jgi:hypothetical protein
LEAAHPELYDYREDHFDAHNLARSESKHVRTLLQEMARSPVFPRRVNDFGLQKETRELE